MLVGTAGDKEMYLSLTNMSRKEREAGRLDVCEFC